ncbi:hypothetical protein RN001_000790 [Aquatica leii]|uniref:Uncharacterized protein n=1 Tax=Aquatica leii TaxID=1421715 RepID=A0AAN7SKT6_9COLE|nr:hypothetical protein RN001_000790 [Aquatica leii]
MMINQPPPPPAYSMPMPQPIGFEQPPPPPLNAGMHQIPTSNYVYPSGAPYATEPLVQQQARIAALNATPRPYSSGWRGYSYGDRKVAMVIIGVVAILKTLKRDKRNSIINIFQTGDSQGTFYANRKAMYLISGVFFIIFVIVFLIVLYT